MPAGEHYYFVIEVVLLEFLDYLLGKFRQERHVVLRIDNERAARPALRQLRVLVMHSGRVNADTWRITAGIVVNVGHHRANCAAEFRTHIRPIQYPGFRLVWAIATI